MALKKVKDAAKKLGVSDHTVLRWIDEGIINANIVQHAERRTIRIEEEEIDRVYNKQKQ